jgi:hypothetical protein
LKSTLSTLCKGLSIVILLSISENLFVLKHFDIYCFEFEEPDKDEEIYVRKYMKSHDW